LKLSIDPHIHSVHSGDSHIGFKDIVRRCQEERLDGFAVTDHDVLTDVPEDLVRDSDLIVVTGMEITAEGGHVVALNIGEKVPKDLPIDETVDRIHDQGGAAIIAHPYSIFRTWVDADEIEEASFDCVEVANAHQFPYGWMLRKNSELAGKLGLPVTGGSDAHIPRVIGRAFTVLEAETRDVEGILKAIGNGNTEAMGRGITLAERLKLVKK
jgi:predicted metal-dependent phosphoesterase TrpH